MQGRSRVSLYLILALWLPLALSNLAAAQNGASPAAGTTTPSAPAASAPAPAAPPVVDFSGADRAMNMDVNGKINGWTARLDKIEEGLNADYLRYRDLDKARAELEEIRVEIDKFSTELVPKMQAAQAQVDSLGPVPKADTAPEPEAVALHRAELTRQSGGLMAAKNASDALKLRTSQLISKVQEIRRQKFTERLFERVPEAHADYTWRNAPKQLVYALVRSAGVLADWWTGLETQWDIWQAIFGAILLAMGLSYLAQRGVNRFRRWDEPGPPPFWRRSASAAWVIILRAMPFVATSAFLYYALSSQQLLPKRVDMLAYSAMQSIIIVATVCALIATALVPRSPQWRLVPMSDSAATRIRWLVVALAAVYSLTLFLDTIRSVASAPFTLTVAQGSISSVIIALLVMAILLTRRDAPDVEGAPEFDWLRFLRIPLWGMAIIILLTTLSGYTSLARFLSTQLIVTGTIIAVGYLLFLWIDAFGYSLADEKARAGKWLQSTFAFEERRREQIALPVTLLFKFAALICTIPLILLQWGFEWSDISEWSYRLFFGFRVGSTEISVAGILASIVVFILGYLFVKLIQGWLDKQVMAPAGISGGARHSVKTAVGYIGVVIAALFAISYTGLDLSNLALVAGALSVGIGLGLQGVVNNFVSGLILLVERPIKVGDWVIVGGEEGIVKRISVRSTEIETFDRANVLIPNSFFISEKVKNWTLHNYSGRIMIAVGVEYSSDPRRVKELLLEVAQAHPQVMTNPAPFVSFNDFGADALNFSLFAYTYDITKSLGLRTDLRIGIVEAFRKEGIEIPYRQTDIHFRDTEWMKELFRPRQAAQPSGEFAKRRRRRKIASPAGNGGNGSNGQITTTSH